MNQDLQNLEIKVENEGATPQGRVTATEWNILVAAVKSLDLGGLDEEELAIYLKPYAKSADIANTYALKTDIPDVSDFVDKSTYQEISAIKNFQKGIQINGSPVVTYDPATQSWLLEGNIIVTGGIATRAALGALNAPTIMDALVVDNQKLIIDNGVLTLNPNLDLGGLDTEELKNYLKENNYATTSDITSALEPYAKATDVANTYATIASLTAVTSRLDDFLSGSDTDTIINKWKELETFLSGLSESDNLATLLSGKADKATTLAGYGITNAYTKTEINTTVNNLNTAISDLRTYTNNTFVKLATAQPITARHDFTDGLKIGGLPIYKSQDDVVYVDGNLVVRGGITARGTNGTTAPSIYDGLPIDGTSIYWENGVLKSSATSSGGIDEAQLEEYLTANAYATVSDITSALNGYATQSWVTGRGYLTGITGTMVTSALGYAPAAVNTGLTSADNNAIGYGYYEGGWPEAGSAMVFGLGKYKAGISVGAYGSAIRYGYTAGTTSFTWRTILDSSNYSNYALPITGGTVNGNILATGSLRLGLNNRTRIIENPFGASGMTLADSNNNPLVTVSYYVDHAYIYNYKNSKENSGISFYDDGTIVASQNFICMGGITTRYTSDMRLKKNRRGFKASELLMSLGAVQQFEYISSEVAKNKIYEGTHIGLIYQNVVGTALNRMCHEREDGYGSLNYLEPSFIALLAGVGQEHETRIQQLERENKALKKEVEQLKQRVA